MDWLATNIVDTIHSALLILDGELRVLFANRSFYQTFSTSPEKTLGRFLSELGDRQLDIPELKGRLATVLAQDIAVNDFLVDCDFPLSGKRIMNLNARRLHAPEDPSQFILVGIDDITERVTLERELGNYRERLEELVQSRSQKLKEAQTRILEEKERLDVTLQSIGDGVIAVNTECEITLVNHVAEALTGWSQEEAAYKTLKEVFHTVDPRSRRRCKDPVEAVMKKREIIHFTNKLLIAKNGKETIITASGSPIRNGDGKIIGVIFIFRDVTEKLAREAELRQSLKVESIGTLASGIAHDFNNILTGIMGYTELAILNASNETKVSKYLKNIYQSSERAKELIRQILTFSRQEEKTLDPVSISPLVKEALKLLRASLPTTIAIQTDIRSHSNVMADLNQLHQVIVNLCTNAVQAMPEGRGVLHISATDVEIREPGAEHPPELKPGKYVELSIEDTGHGIPEEIREKIFDPYFTTKQRKKGTGLGLSVVHGIIKSHNGFITVSSEPGKGARFNVLLPVVATEAAVKTDTLPFERIPKGTEHILFVDDEPQIAQMVKTMLKHIGYHITTHTSSMEALETFRSAPDKFDLVITDMTMPELTGDQLAQKLREIRIDIPIILCTGYSSKTLEDNLMEVGIRALILKPITMRTLSRTIRQVLDENLAERRRVQRFKITDEVIATSESDPVHRYQVVDISSGGLGLVYSEPPHDENRGSSMEFSRIAISTTNEDWVMDKIPCRILSDMELIDASYAWPEKKKRRSIRFGELSERQTAQLEYVIQHCAAPV